MQIKVPQKLKDSLDRILAPLKKRILLRSIKNALKVTPEESQYLQELQENEEVSLEDKKKTIIGQLA